MSHTNVQSTRSWNLRSQNYRQGSETDLSVKTTTSASNQPGRSGYSAHRERLRQERERELLMRQQQKRQLAASSTGLNEQLHQQNRQQQQYRSLSAVNTPSVSEAVEEIETVVLQFIGRGVQDVDSRVGSMTTLPRGRGGSMTDGLQNVDSSQRGGLAKRGYSSTQFLARNNSNSDLVKPMPMHQSQTMISPSPQPLQASRFNTSATLVNHSQATVLLNGSRGHLSPTNSTAAPTTTTPVITNGWKVDGSVKQPFIDRGQDNGNLGIVQDTAPSWYRPKLSREAAINILRQQPPGNFLIRDSTTFKGAYGLAVKVATLPPKVTQKSDDLQSELVRHYLIEVVNTPTRGVRLKGFASEPVFPSLAALIHQHTIDPLALPCRLILPPVPTNLPSSGSATLPPLVIGTVKHASAVEDGAMPDNVTVASSGSVRGAPSSEVGSLHTDGPVGPPHRMDGIAQMPIQVHDNPVPSHNVPYVCVVREGSSPQRRSPLDITGNQGLTFRCLMLGSVDTPQWSSELCFARAVDQLIPLTLLTASECDHGVSRVRYTEVQLHVSAHDGITIIDLQRRLFLRRHLPNHVLLYCGLESRKKEFSHPEHQIQGLIHPRIFGIVVRKGISECTTHVFSELDRAHTADYVVQHIRATYPHMNVR
ncbi:Tensin-1, variant 4 [Clonorchis sinensis]|nr:Tensin-1, variant 4 [Clonorchis sinensis]